MPVSVADIFRACTCLTALRLLVAGFAISGAVPSQAHTQIVIYEDDFEGPVRDWSDTRTETHPDLTTFLGRFALEAAETSRTFKVPEGTARLEIEFDFLRFDSWDDGDTFGYDRFEVDIDGVEIFSLRYFVEEEAVRSGSTGNVSWSHETIVAPAHLAYWCCEDWTRDRVDRYRIVIQSPGTTVDLVLRADVSQKSDDESAGYDNFRVRAFFAPDLDVTKSVTVPGSAPSGPYAVPGNTVEYTVTISNDGGEIDGDSIVLIDMLPPEIALFTGDLDGTGVPVVFDDVSRPASGLTCCTSDMIAYSSSTSPAAPFDYVPTGTYDPAIRRIRITPKGALRDGSTSPAAVSFRFRARVG